MTPSANNHRSTAWVLLVVAAMPLCAVCAEPNDAVTGQFLYVFVYRSLEPAVPAANAAVLAVRVDRVEQIGITDKLGKVSIAKDSLREGVSALLFCASTTSWSCNALRLDSAREEILTFDELSVELAGGLQIVDRRRVKASDKVTGSSPPVPKR